MPDKFIFKNCSTSITCVSSSVLYIGPSSPVHSPQKDVPIISGEVAPSGKKEDEGLAGQTPHRGAAAQLSEQRPSSEQSRQLLAEFIIMLSARCVRE